MPYRSEEIDWTVLVTAVGVLITGYAVGVLLITGYAALAILPSKGDITNLESKMDKLESKLDSNLSILDSRLVMSPFEGRMAMESKLGKLGSKLESRLDKDMTELKSKLDKDYKDMTELSKSKLDKYIIVDHCAIATMERLEKEVDSQLVRHRRHAK